MNGSDGDGDATSSENQSEFRRFVMEHTDGKGVHFVMADGVRISLYISYLVHG